MAHKLDPGIWMNGRSRPIWHYTELPEGLRPASLSDLSYGTPVLYRVLIGPDAGDFYTDFVRESTREALQARIRAGILVYVRAEN